MKRKKELYDNDQIKVQGSNYYVVFDTVFENNFMGKKKIVLLKLESKFEKLDEPKKYIMPNGTEILVSNKTRSIFVYKEKSLHH